MTTSQTAIVKPRTDPRCGCASPVEAVDHRAVKARGEVLAALADPIRLGIVQLLSKHDRLCVCHLNEAFPVEQPTISHHLRLLREAELVDVVRRGQWAYYGDQHRSEPGSST